MKSMGFGVTLTLLLIGMLTSAFNTQYAKAGPTTWYVDDDGPADFDTIQEAIDAASSGDTIFVREGVYEEKIWINKTLRVLGENRDTVTITRNETGEYTVHIVAENVIFSGFTVLGNKSLPSGPGDPIYQPFGIGVGADFATIVNNKIVSCVWGIFCSEVNYCDLSYNVFVDNSRTFNLAGNRNIVSFNEFYNPGSYSLVLGWPWQYVYECKIVGNIFYTRGIYIPWTAGGEDNLIVENMFVDLGIEDWDGRLSNTSVYHNSFMHESGIEFYGDILHARDWRFDNGYPDGGNYWVSYGGKDSCSGPSQNETGMDGIGDTPHIFAKDYFVNLTDNYPLMRPYGSIRNLNTGKNYFTIQSAINDTETSSGDTIQIKSGIYYESVAVSKSLSLVGESKETTILDGNRTAATILHVEANNVIIRGFTIQNASTAGISATMSNHTKIVETLIMNNQYGVILKDSSNTVITRSILNRNDVGIQFLDNSSNNIVFHNSFLDNNLQISNVVSGSNVWDNGCEGNYWSDYNGTDASIPPDGIGDTPYVIDDNNTDRYPLMNPYWNPTDINHDLKVDIKDLATAALAFGSFPGHPNWNPHADITGPEYLVPDGKVDIRDLALIAINFGEIYS